MQAYPCLCSYYAIYKLGRFSFYLLVPRHTSPYSLLANAMLMCRFAPPLAFNFMAGIALPPGKSYSPGRDVTETVSCLCLFLCSLMNMSLCSILFTAACMAGVPAVTHHRKVLIFALASSSKTPFRHYLNKL